jgi:hypothetical protein
MDRLLRRSGIDRRQAERRIAGSYENNNLAHLKAKRLTLLRPPPGGGLPGQQGKNRACGNTKM